MTKGVLEPPEPPPLATPLMMPGLSKSCPKCSTNVHARRCVCDCGHSFAKPKISFSAARKSNQISMKCKRTLETAIETMYRKDWNRTNMAKKRALESPIETMFRLVSQATPSNHCEREGLVNVRTTSCSAGMNNSLYARSLDPLSRSD